MIAACLVALSQTGGVGILMWITTLFVMVLKITPAEASYLMIYVGVLGIIGRLVASWMSDALGRRMSGFLIGMGGALAMALAGYLHDAYIGTVSVFFVLIMVQRFFGDASYAIIGPYLAEVWPNRLRASGMGFSYGTGKDRQRARRGADPSDLARPGAGGVERGSATNSGWTDGEGPRRRLRLSPASRLRP